MTSTSELLELNERAKEIIKHTNSIIVQYRRGLCSTKAYNEAIKESEKFFSEMTQKFAQA